MAVAPDTDPGIPTRKDPNVRGLVFDSDAWHDYRDGLLREWIPDADARAWMLDIFDVAEVLDDLVDRDRSVAEEDLWSAIWELLVDLPNNPFFRRHRTILTLLIENAVTLWRYTTDLERDPDGEHAVCGSSRQLTYGLKESQIPILCAVINLVRGRDYLATVMPEIYKMSYDAVGPFEGYAARVDANLARPPHRLTLAPPAKEGHP